MKIYVYKSYEYKIGIYSCIYEYIKIYENKVILWSLNKDSHILKILNSSWKCHVRLKPNSI